MAVVSNYRRVPLWALVAFPVAVLGAAALAGLWFYQAHSGATRRVAALEAENRDFRARSAELAREVESLRTGVAPAAPAPVREPSQGAEPDMSRTLDQNRFVYQLRDKLAAAAASIDSLQNRVQELQKEVESAKQESARLAAAEADAREKVNASGRVLEAVQSELKGKTDRLTQAEISNKLLKDENRALSDKLSRLPSVLRELDEVNRRRELSLASILRRYKEVTDQYRAVSDRLEKSESGPPAPGLELSRINSAISMAEEDIRQLTTLNAQAARLRQRLNGN